MSRIHPERLDPVPSDRSVAADVLVREEPEEEEDEEEDEGDRKEDGNDDDEDDGYSEGPRLICVVDSEQENSGS